MISWMEVISRIVVIGVCATAVMDIWLLLLTKLNVPTLNFAMLGRWIGHVLGGQWFHEGVAKSAPIRHELAIGWLAHYSIGVGFAVLHVAIFGIEWIANPTFAPAVVTGISTVIAPFFILQPAMGSGIASLKTSAPLRNCFKSLINHTVFGCGIYLAGILLRWI